MANYRRILTPGSIVFLTLVTYRRTPIFAASENVQRLREALAVVHSERPFDILSAVVLPDHIHFLWTLPSNDSNYSYRVSRLKVLFTWSLYGRGKSCKHVTSHSRRKHRESDVWQRWFWEHTIRNEAELQRHLD